MSKENEQLPAESQSARRLKYGAVVGLTIVIAILLATGVIIAAERKPKRVDTTAVGLYSLKPQTINIIKDNTQTIRITSLYTKAKSSEEQQAAAKQQTGGQVDAAQGADIADQADKVADLLQEYHSKGSKIEVESIDPITNPVKRDQLVTEVTEKYAGQVATYEAFVGKKNTPGSYAAKFKELQAALDAESAALKELPFAQAKSQDLTDVFGQVYSSLRELISDIKQTPDEIKRDLRDNPPLLKKGADQIKEVADSVTEQMTQIIDFLTKAKNAEEAKTLPDPIKKYIADSVASYTKIKAQAEAISKQAAGLGELKLDTLGDALRQKNSILIRGDTDWKVIPYDQVWRRDLVQNGGTADTKTAPRFAGEQMITAAIWSLDHPQKLKVVFVRAGGQPVTQPGFPPLIPGGLYADVAERLREYNYDVLDKDLTGMSQMQQQQMGPPEPSEAEIKDAVWVVVDWPTSQDPRQPSPTISSKVADHLTQGGSALFLVSAPDLRSAEGQGGGAKADDMMIALKPWGIELDTDRIVVHPAIKVDGAQGTELEKAMRLPFIFQISDWGDSPVTAPLQSLPGVVVSGIRVKRSDVPGVKSWSILPTPSDQQYWAESNLPTVPREPTYSKSEGDIEGPLNLGAVAEKAGAGRVVVIGCLEMPMNGVIRYRDSEGQVRAAPFPGNSEVFMDSIFWLSHQEPMIAISPAAMDVSRLAPMTRATQNFWRGGVLLALLPALAVVMGVIVFVARKD